MDMLSHDSKAQWHQNESEPSKYHNTYNHDQVCGQRIPLLDYRSSLVLAVLTEYFLRSIQSIRFNDLTILIVVKSFSFLLS